MTVEVPDTSGRRAIARVLWVGIAGFALWRGAGVVRWARRARIWRR